MTTEGCGNDVGRVEWLGSTERLYCRRWIVEAREPVTVGRPLHGVRTCVMSADSERMQLHHNNFVHARAYHEYRLAVHDADCRI